MTTGGWDSVRLDLMESRRKLISDYDEALGEMRSLADLTFKPSSVERFQEYEFFPTNLHLQCLWVENVDERRFEPKAYDAHTVGAFTAVSQVGGWGG